MKKLCPKCRTVFESDSPLCPKHGIPLIHDYAGRIIDDRYRIGRVIGLGGTGAVYKGEHIRMKRPVAIKFLPKTNATEAARFHREAQATSRLDHPHIISVYDFGETMYDDLFLVMELLDGVPLSRLRGKVTAAEKVVTIGAQVCGALEDAHAEKIVHRDLKPDNIFLMNRDSNETFVKVLDFGIAKVLKGAETLSEATLTSLGVVCGTPYYMAPEQVTGSEVDERTDLYALAVILFQMFTGGRLFSGDSVNHLLSKHVYEKPRGLREVAPSQNYSVELENTLLRCLEKKNADRYPSASHLRERFEKFLSGEIPLTTSTPEPMEDDETVSNVGPAGAKSAKPSKMIVVPAAGKEKKIKAKVLLVDDSLYLAAKLTPLLSERGFEVLLARDGLEGVEQLQKSPDVAVCVTDINMPRMDGLTFLRKVRNEMGLKDLKVMVLSTENSRGLFEQAEDLGVLAWIVKPANPQVLVEAIETATLED